MHLALLPWLIVSLAGGALGGTPAHIGNSFGSSLSTANAIARAHISFSVAAQATTTATLPTLTPTAPAGIGAITATATISSSIATTVTNQATPVPLPTAVGQPNLQGNPLSWQYLTSVASPPVGPFAWAYLVFMLALAGVSGYFYFVKRPQWKRTNSVQYRAANRWAPVGMWAAGVAILFLFFRAVSLDFFNLRFWLYLWLLVAIAAAGWFFYWYRTAYPKEMARYLKTQRVRQYMPGASSKAASKQPAAPPRKGGQPRPTPQASATTKPNPTSTSTSTSTPTPGQAPNPNAQQRSQRRKRR